MKKETIQKIIAIILLVAALAYGVVLLYSTHFVHYQADDFSYMMRNLNTRNSNPDLSYLHVALSIGINLYLTWQGSWLNGINTGLLFGLQDFGLWAFQVMLALTIVAVMAGGCLLVYEVAQRFDGKEQLFWFAVLIAAFIWSGMNTTTPAEVYFWIDGSLSYSIPISYALFGLALYLRYMRTNKIRYMILSAVLGFISSGGQLTMVALVNAIYLVIFIYRCAEKKKIAWKFGVPFYGTLAGALINACAPGNFVRHDAEIGEGFHIREVLRMTLGNELLRYKALLQDGFLIGTCVLVVVLVMIHGKGLIRTRFNPVLPWLYSFFTIYIMIFPFDLAYRLEGYISDRVQYQVDLAAAALTVLCCLYTAAWLCNKDLIHISGKQTSIVLAAGLLAFIINIGITGTDNSYVINNFVEVLNGSLQAHYDQVEAIYEEIRTSEEEDVVITAELPKSDIMKDMDVRTYPEYWANSGIATYFEKSSVVFTQAEY